MRLIASSDPTAVPRAEAMALLNERLVLANAVCAELEACEDSYASDVPAAALSLLRRWVAARYPIEDVEVLASDGLDGMVVPDGAEARMAEVRSATYVCEALAWMWTADTQSEFVSDRNKVTTALTRWREGRPAGPAGWRRPLPGYPAISLPEEGQQLSPELAYAKRASSIKQAGFWNMMLKENVTYGPPSGYVVGVVDHAQDGRWPMVWTPER